jgi:hypothetical protein
MDETVDLLKIKIEEAKRQLPLETINAINTVDWRMAILGLRAKKGYTFEQLGDLELETELLLSGLVSPEDYPKELSKRLGIPRTEANDLVNEMNDLVFKKIRGELVKNTERKKIFASKMKEVENNDKDILESAGIKIIPDPGAQTKELESGAAKEQTGNRENMLKIIEKPEEVTGEAPAIKPENAPDSLTSKQEVHPILEQKLSGSNQIPIVKTEHFLDNLTPTSKGVGIQTENVGTKTSKIDPYREIPE